MSVNHIPRHAPGHFITEPAHNIIGPKNIRIGLGNRWRNVYEFLYSKNLSTSGGRVAGIGIGGLVLGVFS